MERRDAIKAMGVWLTSALIAPHINIEPAGVIFPDPVNEIVRIDLIGKYAVMIVRQFDALLLYGDVVLSEEFQGWVEIINTT